MICIFDVNIYENVIVHNKKRYLNFGVLSLQCESILIGFVDLDDNKCGILQKMVSLAFPILFK